MTSTRLSPKRKKCANWILITSRLAARRNEKPWPTGDEAVARSAYESMSALGFRGASTAALGLADVAMYRGDYDAARTLLDEGIAADEAAGSQYFVATKYIALAEAELAAGNEAEADEALENGLGASSRPAQTVPAALMYLQMDDVDKAREFASSLSQQLQPTSRAYGQLVEAAVALHDGEHVQAIDTLTSAIERSDLWLVRFYRGRAFLDGGFFAEALDEFRLCESARGEATAVFLDDLPTYRYLATLPYWIGRAQEGMGMAADAQANYSEFVSRRPGGGPLADDARQRMQ